ncbi:hypothetical protein ABIB34_001011 [Rhodococcus sp. UYP5]
MALIAGAVTTADLLAAESAEDLTPSPGPDNFWYGIVAGWNSLVDTGRDALVALGRAVLWLGTLTVGAQLGYVIVRIVRRHTLPANPCWRHASYMTTAAALARLSDRRPSIIGIRRCSVTSGSPSTSSGRPVGSGPNNKTSPGR